MRFVTIDGRQLARYGRAGRGPGEFQRLFNVTALGDTALAFDFSQRRVSYFTVRDGHIRTVAADRGFRGLLVGGGSLMVNTTASSAVASGAELWPDTIEVSLTESSGATRRLLRAQGTVRLIDVRTAMDVIMAPFSPHVQVKAAPHVVIVGVGRPEIERFRVRGAVCLRSECRSPNED